jgi:Skp family chaperone for outer membrane proteins
LLKISSVLGGIFLLALSTGCNVEPPKIGVVDVVKVTNESMAGKKANAELQALVTAKRTEAKNMADAIDNLKKNLDMGPEATRKARAGELKKANADYKKFVAAADAEVQKKAAELKNKVLGQIKKVLETIGQEEKFLLIHTNENAPYFNKNIDISDKVINKYNELEGSK